MNIYNTFVLSDTHFNHERMFHIRAKAGIGGFSCTTMREMNDMLVENWNSVVSQKDYVVVVGDFTWKEINVEPLLKALHGRKILAIGNHDTSGVRKCPLWEHTGDIVTLKVGEESGAPKDERLTIHCCHYPMRTWNKSFDGTFHIYGHTHGDDMRDAREFNAGVDMSIDPYRPRRLDHVLAAMQARWYPARGTKPLADTDETLMDRFREDYRKELDIKALIEEKKAVAEKMRQMDRALGGP